MTYPDTAPTLRLHFSDGFKYYGDATTITATATVNLPVPVARYLGDNTEIQDGQVLTGPLEDFRVPNPQALGWTTTTGSRIRGWSYDLTVTVSATGNPTVLWSATIRPANGVETITPGMGTITGGNPSGGAAPETSDAGSTIVTGDSLTDGGSNGALWPEADTWAYQVNELLDTTVTNHGFTGATVDEMLLRVGALDAHFTPTGGAFTLGGTTALTTTRVIGTYPSRRFTIAGTISGVYGLLEHTSGGAWNFINYDAAGTHAVAGAARFVPDWAGNEGASWVVMIGRNDVTAGITGNESTVADHVVAGVQHLMDWLTPRVPRVLLTGVTTRTNETTGTTNHDTVMEINARLRSLYPGKFKALQDYLTDPDTLTAAGITPTTADNDALANGTIPPSLMDAGDVTHVSKATAALMATDFYAPTMLGRGWR